MPQFNIGDTVMANNIHEDFHGRIGIVMRTSQDWGTTHYAVRMNEHHENLHDCNGLCERGYGWNFREHELVLVPNGKVSKRTCSCCKQVLPKIVMEQVHSGKYVCPACIATQNYSTRNNTTAHKRKGHNKTYGFEFECIPNSKKDKAAIMSYGYSFIPCYDGSLPDDGVEFKTPIYQSLNGLKPMLRTMEKHVNLKQRQCGQHINIGDTEWINEDTVRYVREYARTIFHPLYVHLKGREVETKRIVGRYFTYYADETCYTSHTSWINLSHENRIEFRLSKFKNANQYFQLTCMWTEMMDCLINNFIKKYKEGDYVNNELNAVKTSAKLIKVFTKYAEGKATCQRPERNKFTVTGTKRRNVA